MAWFLSGNKSKKKKSKAKRDPNARAWDPQRTLLGLKIFGIAALVVAAAVGWNTTEHILGKYAKTHRTAAVTAQSVQLVDAPAWMSQSLADELKAKVAYSVNDNPLDARGLRDAAAMLNDDNDCPWVAAVHQVRRVPRGIVKVTAAYRRPAALVEAKTRGQAHVVDRDGVWLEGPIDRAASRWSGLPLITGVNAPPPDDGYGKKWPGSDITAALQLEDLLRGELYADQVTAYDVSHRDLRGRLWLVLYTDGPAIVWGLPPGEERSVEPQAPVKLAALRDWAYKHAGRINVRGEADTVWVYTGTAQIDARPTPDPGSIPSSPGSPGSVSASRR